MKNYNIKNNQSFLLSKLSKKNILSLKKAHEDKIEINIDFEDWINNVFCWDKRTVLTYNIITIVLYFVTIISSKNSAVIMFYIFSFIYFMVLISTSIITAMDNRINPVLYVKSKIIYLISYFIY